MDVVGAVTEPANVVWIAETGEDAETEVDTDGVMTTTTTSGEEEPLPSVTVVV